MAAKRKIIDREKLELDYRAGILTFREMATKHGLSGPRIKQIADEEKWERDLAAKIKQVAEAKLNKVMLNEKLNNSPEKKASETEIVEFSANQVVAIRKSHRAGINRMRELVIHLTNEVELQSIRPDFFLEIEALLAGIPKGTVLADVPEFKEKAYKISAALEKALALGSRTVTLKALVESFSRLVALEREAYGINAGALDPEDAMTSMLIRLQGTARTITPIADDIDLLPAP